MRDTERRTVSRACLLLQRVVASRDITIEQLAEELVVSPRLLGQYLCGECDIPLLRQLCLAKLLIERVPRMARQGYALQGQASAAIAVEQRMQAGE